MKRREFISLVGGAAAAWPRAVWAQTTKRVWRIGVMDTTSVELNGANFAAFVHALQNLGYIENENLVIEYRSADGRPERFSELAKELVGKGVDIILARGTPAALAVKNFTNTIPVVMASSANPFSVIASLARPGGNVTGLSSLIADLHPKRLEILKELLPNLTRVAYLTDASNPNFIRTRGEIETAAAILGLEVIHLDFRRPEDIGTLFQSLRTQNANALVVGTETRTQANRDPIIRLSAEYQTPAIYSSREFVDAGGLIALGVNYPDLYRRSATYVDKILKGAKPSDLPVEQPTKLELVINLKTAKALGLEVPPSLLARADEVIE